MRGRKVGICNWCSKGNVLEIFSYKCKEKKNTRHGGEILIYNASFYIFKLIFIIFFALQEAYKEFIEKMVGENSKVLGILGTLGQLH